jgi:sulfhydrogenase subunit beta (sulfur reductase)
MKVITQDALKGWLDRLASQVTLFAPRSVDGIILYRPVAGSDEIAFDYTRPKMSAKEVIFPSTDVIVSIEKHNQDVTLSEPQLAKKQVIFGLRPCDAHGISVLDAVYIGKEPVDATYARRREATTLVGLSCPQMWEGCFCTSMGGAPDDPSHVDVLLIKVDEGYAVNVVTDKGRALVGEIEKEMRDRDVKLAPPSLSPVSISLDSIRWPERFTDRYWDLLAERCIGCRVCTYVCPTCRCFDVRDQVAERRTNYAKYDRLRCWDACTGFNYRVTAGGHNPRPTKGQRLRNRFFCKFYYMPQDYGPTGCVGCGRCIEACPVNIDIVEMLHDVSKAPVASEVTA